MSRHLFAAGRRAEYRIATSDGYILGEHDTEREAAERVKYLRDTWTARGSRAERLSVERYDSDGDWEILYYVPKER